VSFLRNSTRDYIDRGNEYFTQGDYGEALKCYRKALCLDKTLSVAYFNIANILAIQSKFYPAEQHYKYAIRYKRDFPEAFNNLGNVLREQGKLSEAYEAYKKALFFKCDYFEAYNGLGNVLQSEGNIEDAINSYRKAIDLNPKYQIAKSNLLLCLNYSSNIKLQNIYEEHTKLAESIEKSVKRFKRTNPINKIKDKIRIGYLSPDFRRHSVGYFIRPIIECHNRDDFVVFAYSDVITRDTFTDEIERMSDHFIDCARFNENELYQKICDDKIDILFDLAGHSGYNRLTIFAMKPAPIQITWIGYPNTTGLKTMDYRIVDEITDPIGMTESINSEKLLRMPYCFLCYSPPKDAPIVEKAPFLKNGFITFGSFNNLSKINDFTVDLWSKVLHLRNDSKMLIKSKTFIDKGVRDRFLKRFQERGIDESRLILMPHVKSFREHLDVYNSIDIALDCYPYNGTTTTFEALFMGVPVITLSGNSHVSRVGMSILTNLFIEGLIAKNSDEYIKISSNLISNPDIIISLRKALRGILMNSILVDKMAFTRQLEEMLKKIILT